MKGERKSNTNRKKNFTLIELFLSFALIIIAGTLLTMQSVQWLDKKNLSTAQLRSMEIFQFCHYMAHIEEEDIFCHIEQEEGNVRVAAFFAKDRRPLTSSTFEKISLKEEVEILFPARGGIITSSPIIFYLKNKKQEIDPSLIGLARLDIQ